MLAPPLDRIRSTLTARQAADHTWDAIVIGAGPAGSIAALQLARSQLRVLLLEKSAHPRYKVCGGCLGARSVAMLKQLGLAETVAACGGNATHQLYLRSGERSVRMDLPAGISVSREAFDAALVTSAIAAGVQYVDQTTARLAGVSYDRCHIRLRGEAGEEMVSAKVLLAADGLASTAVCGERLLATTVKATSHVGLGAMLEPEQLDGVSLVEPGVIAMHYAPGGYVGLAQVEQQRVNIAAALDPHYIRKAGGPAKAIVRHLESAGVRIPQVLRELEYQGTPALSRQRSRMAMERVFVIGDSTGYVEPFTGEGMAWAMEAAMLAAPLAAEAVRQWHFGLAEQWQRQHRLVIQKQQRSCRVIAAALRHHRMCDWALRLMGSQPVLARAAVRYVSGSKFSVPSPVSELERAGVE